MTTTTTPKFTSADVINADDWIPQGEYNPHNVRPWLFHDHGHVLGIVFADNYGDAEDELADSGKVDHLLVDASELSDYPDEVGLSFVGNFCKPYNLETMSVLELPNPQMNWSTLYHDQFAS